MTTYLSLSNASLARLKGWGRSAKPNDYDYRIELADVGQLAVYGTSILREKQLLAMSIEHLEITASTEQVTTPGGYRASYSLMDGILERPHASRLRPVAGKTREYTLLRTRTTLPNGAQREADFAFRFLNESDLGDQLALALRAWADGYIKATLSDVTSPALAESDLAAAYAKIDQMRQRAVLDSTQALILCSHASKPFVAAILNNLRAGTTSRSEARQLLHEVDELHQARRLTNEQAHQIHEILAPIIAAPDLEATSEARLRQIELLAQLRSTGALTEQEFQNEKSRLLGRGADR